MPKTPGGGGGGGGREREEAAVIDKSVHFWIISSKNIICLTLAFWEVLRHFGKSSGIVVFVIKSIFAKSKIF